MFRARAWLRAKQGSDDSEGFSVHNDENGKIRLLFFGSHPEGTEELDLDRDWDLIQDTVDVGQRHRDLLLRPVWQPTIDALFDEINVFKPHALHLSGHGARREGLFFTGPDGGPEPVSAEGLTHLLRSVREEGPDLVVLAACRSLPLARAATRFVKCAVGVEADLDDDVAARFIRGFYGGLATGRSVSDAFEQGEGRVRAAGGVPGRSRFRLEFNARVDPSGIFLGRQPCPSRPMEASQNGGTPLDQGRRFLDLRLYAEAAARFREALRTGGAEADAHYYLAFASLRGRRPAQLISLDEARAIEAHLAAAVQLGAHAHHYYLWAWLKLDYYQRHGLLLTTPPGASELLRQAQALSMDEKELNRLLSLLPPGAPDDAVTAALRVRGVY